jgi:hypothetical protein
MKWLLAGLIVGISAIVSLIRRSRRRLAQAAWDRAVEHERKGEYAEACYEYALATAGGPTEAVDHVRVLWSQHGPFSFEEIGARMRATYDPDDESCGEGFHQMTLQLIRRILESKSGRDDAR